MKIGTAIDQFGIPLEETKGIRESRKDRMDEFYKSISDHFAGKAMRGLRVNTEQLKDQEVKDLVSRLEQAGFFHVDLKSPALIEISLKDYSNRPKPSWRKEPEYTQKGYEKHREDGANMPVSDLPEKVRQAVRAYTRQRKIMVKRNRFVMIDRDLTEKELSLEHNRPSSCFIVNGDTGAIEQVERGSVARKRTLSRNEIALTCSYIAGVYWSLTVPPRTFNLWVNGGSDGT